MAKKAIGAGDYKYKDATVWELEEYFLMALIVPCKHHEALLSYKTKDEEEKTYQALKNLVETHTCEFIHTLA